MSDVYYVVIDYVICLFMIDMSVYNNFMCCAKKIDNQKCIICKYMYFMCKYMYNVHEK